MRDRNEIDPKLVEENSEFQNHLGYRLTHWEEGYARLEQPLKPFLMNRIGVPHGGNYSVILDTAMGFSGVYTGDPNRRVYALTLSLSVNFLDQAQGQMLFVEAVCVGGGKRSFFAEGRVFDENERLVATGNGVFQRRESA